MGYIEHIQSMSDRELEEEWQEAEGSRLREVEHEMAMRFRHRAQNQAGGETQYFTSKFLQMPGQFEEAFYRKDWFRAKYIYDSAIAIGLFLELPEHARAEVFGSRQDERRPVEGMFSQRMVDHAMRECVIKDRLGFECVVYRVPGEIGFYGAKHLPGTRHMAAEDNPASRAL